MRCNPISYNTNLYFGNEQAKRHAEYTADTMKLSGVRTSILNDGSNNEYDGSPFRNEDAYPIIDKLEKEYAKVDYNENSDLINWCSDFVKNFSNHPLSKDESMPEDIRDAVIVRFLNLLANSANWSTNTKELKKGNSNS